MTRQMRKKVDLGAKILFIVSVLIYLSSFIISQHIVVTRVNSVVLIVCGLYLFIDVMKKEKK